MVTETERQRKAEPQFLSDGEVMRLISNFTRSMNVDEIDDADLRILTDWALETRVRQMLLNLVLRGKASVSVRDGEVLFRSASGRCVAMN